MTLFAGREVALTAGAKVPGTSADTGIAAAVDDGLLEEREELVGPVDLKY